MIRITAWRPNDPAPQNLDPETFDAANADAWQLIWIDLEGADAESHRHYLLERMKLPRLAVDDALRPRHPPKYEDLEEGWCFQILRGFDADTPGATVGTVQLSLFWRSNILVSRHDKPSASVVDIREELTKGSLAPPRKLRVCCT